MNSMELIQDVVTRWLTAPAASAMNASEIKDVLNSVNTAMIRAWRDLPPHYRQQPVSLEFYTPANGTVSVGGYGQRTVSALTFAGVADVLTFVGDPLYFAGVPLLWNGEPIYESPRPYCSIVIAGDRRNFLDGGVALRNPYLGATTGTATALLHHDAKLTPVLIDQIASVVVDGITGAEYQQIVRHPSDYRIDYVYRMRRIQHDGVTRTLFELTPGHDKLVVLEFDAFVSPVPLSLGSSMRPVDLPFDAEVAGIIVDLAGAGLISHKLFDRERNAPSLAFEAGRAALDSLKALPGQTGTGFNEILTPHGY